MPLNSLRLTDADVMSTRAFERPGTVLVVDDDTDALHRTSRYLSAQNHTVFNAANAAHALVHAREQKPDLVLLDVKPNNLAVLELCRQIKRDPTLDHIIVVLMTSAQDPDAHRFVLESGANDFLIKPFSEFMLDMRVRFALKYHRAVVQMRKNNQDLENRVETRTAELARANAELKCEIAERQRVEESLRESEARYSAIFQATFDGLIIHGGGKVLDFNPGVLAMFGYSRDELMGKPMLELAAPESHELFMSKIVAGEDGPHDGLGRRKDGSVFAIEIVGKNHVWNGRVVRVTALRDISDRKNLEAQLRTAQKMEAVGRLAGGVAHDFNNLLMIITGYTDLMLSRMPENDTMRGDARMIQNAADRAASLTRQLLAFSRRQVLQPKLLELNKIVADMEKMTRRVIGEDIELTTELAPDCDTIKADPGQVEQVIINLVVNARDAMPNGGKLKIATRNVLLDQAFARQHIGARPGRYVMVSIADNGCGMTAKTKAQIFEPFFTTKEQGKGTGLGLSTAYGIVKQSDGYIAVQSDEGIGTVFEIYFPVVNESKAAQPAAPNQAIPQRAAATILLVEDEDGVRELVGELLQQAGYKVLDAANGVAALAICGKPEVKIDLLITDAVMPQMNGRELVDGAKRVRPHLKVLYMSGYIDKAIVHNGILEEGTAFLSKPFKADVLLRKVAEMLAAPDAKLA